MDHLSVELNSVSQSILVRRLQLRQLSVTLSKGQIFSTQRRIISVQLSADCWGLIASLCVCRSVVQIRGAVLHPEPGPTLHREDNPLPACAQQPRHPTGVEWRCYSVRKHLWRQTAVNVMWLCTFMPASLRKIHTLFKVMYFHIVGFYFNSDTAAFSVLKGAGPRNQRAESKTYGAEWQKGT